jgi:mono/diheme cytochrome c family protein
MVAGRTVIAAVCWLALSGAGLHAASAQTVDYARDVLPILSEKCYKCHGPEETDRQKDLRLDLKEGAFRVEEGVAVIVPGKPDKSELVRRISSKDPDEVMPPSDDLRKLSAQQIETLRRWVEQGAKWGTHWAFVAPDKPQIPAGGNPIDAFVRARLNKEKLSPAPEADKATLIRRVTFDLTGLPPTSAEIDAFIADSSPNAYEKLLDRLLASPHYGERMASDWLDVARFATRTATRWIATAQCGRGAIGSSGRSIRTCRSINSSPGNLPATCFRMRRRSSVWRRRSIGCTCRTRRAALSRRNFGSRMSSIA